MTVEVDIPKKFLKEENDKVFIFEAEDAETFLKGILIARIDEVGMELIHPTSVNINLTREGEQ